MTEDDISRIEQRITETIVRVVNGKIDKQHLILERQNEVMDALMKRVDGYSITHESDMAEIKPFLQLYAGSKLLGGFAQWVGKLAFWVLSFSVAWLTYKSLLK